MRKAYDLPTFLGETVPVSFISALKSYDLNGSSLSLTCQTDDHEPELHTYYGTVCETTFKEPARGADLTFRLDFETDDIVRLRFARGDVPTNPTPMVVGQFSGVEPTLEETEAALKVRTNRLELVIIKRPWQLKVCDLEGNLVWATKPTDIPPLMRPEEQWNPPEQRWIFMHRFGYPAGLTALGQGNKSFASFYLQHDEHIYGFGESYGSLDKHGSQQRLWLQEVFSNAAPAAYKQAPFYLSTKGYGLFVNTSNALEVKVGSLEHTTLSVTVEDADFFDAYFIFGPNLKEILPRYTAITGAPALPPKWSFGLWMGRISYDEQVQVEKVAEELREHAIPCDVIHVDTGWFEHDWACDLEFGSHNFPDPRVMTERLNAQGYKVCLWQWPNMLVGTPMFNEGHPKGYFAKTTNDKTYTYPGFMEAGALLDYSNPETVAWVKDKFRNLFEQGVRCIKTDFGEGSPPDAVYADVPSEAMHNRYPLLYNKAVFEVTQEVWGEDEGVVWSRSAWAGSQRYPVHWSGDGIARFEDLPCVLRSTLSFGLTGFPFYSHDIGGFSGVPSPELYVRWAQLGLFSSHARAHGAPPREPWAYGDEAETIFRTYDNLRYRLLPYIYSEAVTCVKSSLPMVRALVIEHPDDPTAVAIDDQYYFGRSLLIAPILTETNRRKVYLPEGAWTDYWTKERLTGGRWLDVDAPLDAMPIYVAAGAVIPYAPLMQYTGEKPLDPLTLELYLPSGEGEYVIKDQHEDDITVRYRREGDRLELTLSETPGEVYVKVIGESVKAVAGAEQEGDLVRLVQTPQHVAITLH